MTVLVSHPHGNPNVRAVLRALDAAGLLAEFHTTLVIGRRLATTRWLPAVLRRELSRRVLNDIPAARVRSLPFREAMRTLRTRMGSALLPSFAPGPEAVDAVYDDLDRAVAAEVARQPHRLRAVYAYEDGAVHTFRALRDSHVKAIYELPSPYWRAQREILSEERSLRADWASAIIDGLSDPDKQARKDEEVARANVVVVASTFAAKCLRERAPVGSRVEIVPYGAPPSLVQAPAMRAKTEPLRLIYAGNLRQNKGIGYLFEAVQRLDIPWHLSLAGARPPHPCPALDAALADPRCRWLGSVPHATLLEEMTKAHVFVFPSLFEGFGLVILEAMAAGLPVITTPHTGGPDCLTDGVDGFIVPIRDADAIARHLTALYEDEDRRQAMGTAALAKAKASSWQRYEQQIVALVKEIIA
jgi:glycosyltransferase involved in cell wall biosynthesis